MVFLFAILGIEHAHAKRERSHFAFSSTRESGTKHCSAASASEALQGGANSRMGLTPQGVVFLFGDPSLSTRRMRSIRSGSHFASKATGACSQEPRAKIFVKDEIPGFFNRIEHAHAKRAARLHIYLSTRESGTKHCSAASVSEALQGGANSRMGLTPRVSFFFFCRPTPIDTAYAKHTRQRRFVSRQAHATVSNILERPVILCYNIGGTLKFCPIVTNQHFPQNVLFKCYLSVAIIKT